MTLNWKVVIDCADPHAQAAFWAAALGYVVEDNRVLIERQPRAPPDTIPQDTVVTIDDRPAFRTLQAVRHPDAIRVWRAAPTCSEATYLTG